MKDCYIVSDIRAINAYMNKIILTDRQIFGEIYRDDVVLVIEENFDRQLNKIFGIGGFKKWWRRIKEGNVIRGFLDWKFRVGTRDELADPVILRNNKVQKHDKWWRAVTNIPIIKLCYTHLSQTRIAIGDKITGFCCYPGREIFLEKFNEKFVAKRFTNQKDLDDYLMNSDKMFFFTNIDSPWSAFKCKKKVIYEKLFANHLSAEKLKYLRFIYEIVDDMVRNTQYNIVNRVTFAILSSRICDELNDLGIKLNIKFEKMTVMCFNVLLQPITYDSPSIMMTVFLNCGDTMVESLFESLKFNFIRWVKQIRYRQIQVTWTTLYIDSVMSILKVYGVIKESIDFLVYPEIVGLLFPHSFFVNNSFEVNSCIIVRSCLCFGYLEKFCKYKEYFDDIMVKRIRYYTNDIMFSLVS